MDSELVKIADDLLRDAFHKGWIVGIAVGLRGEIRGWLVRAPDI